MPCFPLIATLSAALMLLQHAHNPPIPNPAESAARIRMLPPAAFPGLPANLVRELRRRGCTIPQEAYSKQPHNVITGQFRRPGQMDWAALCSTNGVSRILVFWGGSEMNPSAIAEAEDSIYALALTPTGDISYRYSRVITPVGKDVILRHYQAYGGPVPPPITHQGIDDAFVEKGSLTWYFHSGKWLQLIGSD